ncbi:nucleoside 2-deoxyribosyltransferase [Horticoccus luteus]|uniref:Nucleoside 2-deoxyribosyltransferase n=1 Tax=Horticoccus luteus TaxID=2862869 RepID=A0A8F9XKX4_9BACT|nr:nucleoside 2-deoxyribosyltransferase [Horticoccus luteus]QYM78641.1 nucleoside 2-deoxyribosyltransferase [Horticoccus luteus]
MSKTQRSFTVYFAGALFTTKDLIGNAYLAEAIYERSHGRYRSVLPQDASPRGRSPQAIRDHALRALFAADLALFNYDGLELDSGTVAEFMAAKFADIPAVLLRSDARSTTARRPQPWNVMTSFFPRTATVLLPSLPLYHGWHEKRHPRAADDVVRLAGLHASADAQRVCDHIALHCVRAFDRLVALEPVMPKHLREEVYQWLALMPGFRGKAKALRKEFERCLEQKVKRDLL